MSFRLGKRQKYFTKFFIISYYSLAKQCLEKWNQGWCAKVFYSMLWFCFLCSVRPIYMPLLTSRTGEVCFRRRSHILLSNCMATSRFLFKKSSNIEPCALSSSQMYKGNEYPLCELSVLTCVQRKLIYFHLINSVWLRIGKYSTIHQIKESFYLNERSVMIFKFLNLDCF